jgi:hypothetical protein
MEGGVSIASVVPTAVGDGMSEASEDPGSCGDKWCGCMKMRPFNVAVVPEGRLS